MDFLPRAPSSLCEPTFSNLDAGYLPETDIKRFPDNFQTLVLIPLSYPLLRQDVHQTQIKRTKMFMKQKK